ncbi:hypothetical protein K2173_020812 [Erythroxylum novogranatense]|uniref:DUF7950 domain-containing protein n=1 Tax=Erythroxylum novogranatense TaxID=1862640 RepID=A0AAV8TLQ4_9ROSI|nr:hypothetical protein K2173_020812 [Erythroxylum novogranatense]
MDGEGWRVTSAGGVQDKTIINRMMLRFRPIAPKPLVGSSDSGVGLNSINDISALKRRTKRKYVRVCKRNGTCNGDADNKSKRRCKGNNRVSTTDREKQGEDEDGMNKVVTLQLLPERTDLSESPMKGGSWCNLNLTVMPPKEEVGLGGDHSSPFWLKPKEPVFDTFCGLGFRDPSVVVVDSWVTVKCVTDTYNCMDEGEHLGRTDVERVRNLERDKCPGFVSDGSNNVRWVNGAYKKITKVEHDWVPSEIVVKLTIKEELLPYLYQSPVFTCWVRLQHAWQKKEKCSQSQMVPCDVWRMDGGGFAWRLDMDAVLSLGNR